MRNGVAGGSTSSNRSPDGQALHLPLPDGQKQHLPNGVGDAQAGQRGSSKRGRGMDDGGGGVGDGKSMRQSKQERYALQDERYGLLGILKVIKMTDPDLNTLALGMDLTTLGLNLNSPDTLCTTFGGPYADSQIPPAIR